MITHNHHPSGFRRAILLFILLGATAFLVSPAFADPAFVTIAAKGSQSYYLGEKVVFSGVNSDSNSTYLFITGPNLPANGGKLSSPHQDSISGDPGTFTVVKTQPDKTWEYTLYTHDLKTDAGSYTVYAVSRPEAEDQLAEAPYGTTSIILKKPFISANIAPATIRQGQPFTVNGTAEGNPPFVQVWIIGEDILYTTKATVDANASFTYTGNTAMSANLAPGEYYLFVQHPMQNNLFETSVSGDYVSTLNSSNGANLFRISGPGRLNGSDAADALIDAFSNTANHDTTYTQDTYTVIPFRVENTGSSLQAATAPVPVRTQHAPLAFATIGGIALIIGMTVWRRQ